MAAAALLLAAAPARAQRSLAIESFASQVFVGSAGDLDVTETMRVRFTGQWNGVYRAVPVDYLTPHGFNVHLRLSLVSVTDEAGVALRHESRRAGHYRKVQIWVPGARDAVRTVVLRYRVDNPLRFFDEHDELYWNVTGDEWEAPIHHATAEVVLPPGADGVRVSAFTGPAGSTASYARVETEGTHVAVETTVGLGLHEGLTVAIGWNPGVVARPGATRRAFEFLRANVVLVVPLIALAVMWPLWWQRGRDPTRLPVVVTAGPPYTMTPAEIGTLVDNTVDDRDVTATLVDLAVRGYLTIQQTERRHTFGLRSSPDYLFRRRKPRESWAELRPHERLLLLHLFACQAHDLPGAATGEVVNLAGLEAGFSVAVPPFRDAVYARLLAAGYYARRPDEVQSEYLIGGLGFGVMVVAFGNPVSAWLGATTVSLVVAGILTGVIVCGFGYFMPARTRAGTRALTRVLGFQEFLGRVEADRFERVVRTPELFERFLPHAMALGVASRWARAFDDLYRGPGDWFDGTDPPTGSRAFGRTLDRMSAATGLAMSSSPRASGGSGLSGGSSGGGFGGGGGGGF